MIALILLFACSEPGDSAGPLEIERACINELMPRTELGGTDWLELAGEPELSLDGWRLLPGVDAEPVPLDGAALDEDGFLLLLADGLSEPGHVPFGLDADGESLGLQAPDKSREWVSWTEVATDHSMARTTDCCREPDCWQIDLEGTPGAPN